jgi:hypothetical protein
MKRTLSLLLVLIAILALAPAVSADLIWIPEDDFLNDHMDDCSHHQRYYYAAGPDGAVTVYDSPESSAVSARLENGDLLHISWSYTDADGIAWGFCEHYDEDFQVDWDGWMPMDYLLLKYDSQSFREEFADRIESRPGKMEGSGEVPVVFWDYPGSEDISASFVIEAEYLPQYEEVFTDDAGREWASVGYFRGIRNVWICLDAPSADYDTLYADSAPQQVTHPTKQDSTSLPEINPAGPGLGLILAAVCALAAITGGFLWITRKKK